MRALSTSLVLAMFNLLFTGCALIFAYTTLADVAIVIEMVFLPLLLLVTVVFAIRDLLRRATRLYAVVAVFLSIPGAWLVFSITLR